MNSPSRPDLRTAATMLRTHVVDFEPADLGANALNLLASAPDAETLRRWLDDDRIASVWDRNDMAVFAWLSSVAAFLEGRE